MFRPQQIFTLTNQGSFFNKFRNISSPSNLDVTPQNISIFTPEIPSPLPLDDNLSNISNDYSFVKKFGKLAFKYSFALRKSSTKQLEYTSALAKLYATELPSPAVMRYTAEVFGNPSRIQDYLYHNFCKFSFSMHEVSQSCKIYKTDLTQMFREFLSVPFITNFFFFETDRKHYLDNLFDGTVASPAENKIFLSLYYDDFNPLLNCLSSNAGAYKCSSIYIKVLNISPLLASKRSCVLPFAIFYSKYFNNDKDQIFLNLKNDLNSFLSQSIDVGRTSYTFSVIGTSCDNLGAHELLGLSSFSASHFCRYCSMGREEVQELFYPVATLSRSQSTMEKDLSVFNALKADPSIPKSQKPKHINGVCDTNLFLGLNGYNGDTFSFFSCISHDVFEKVVPEVITTIIARMHRDRLINADEIYQCLDTFKLNEVDRQNPINFKSSLSALSASQGKIFRKIFLLALKDKLPYDHPLFEGFLILNKVVDFLYSPFFYKAWFTPLENNISQLLRFVRCTLNLNIYPKLHYLLHYPEIIKKFGPIRYISTDQFESSHRHFKEQLITSCNHKDIITTMFKGALNKFSFMYSEDYIQESCVKVGSLSKKVPSEIRSFVQSKLDDTEFSFVNYVKFYGYKYSEGCYIFCDESNNIAFFKKVVYVISYKDSFLLVCLPSKFKYIEQLHAYMQISSNDSNLSIVETLDVWNEPLVPYKIGGIVYICPSYKLSP